MADQIGKATPGKIRVMKAWALCHRGTPLVVYTQGTRKSVQSECASWNTVMRVTVAYTERPRSRKLKG